MTSEQLEVVSRLEHARTDGQFQETPCNLDDLLEVIRSAPSGLGSGELSCIAVARRIRAIAFMTDDQDARWFASRNLGLTVETTPKLYAWLHFQRQLTDSDHIEVVREHERHESRPLTKYFCEAYHEALRCRLMDGHS